ncbi:MAG: XdhC family protein [Actinomycetota bacterium]|nr:XdhC family protein [Actinomycetota bacterium]
MVNTVVEAIRRLKDSESLGALVTVVDGQDQGMAAVIHVDDGYVAGSLPPEIADDVIADATVLMEQEKSLALSYGERRVLIDFVAPSPVMLIFGAGHIAQPLSIFARELGFRTVVADARSTWATAERFPDVDELIAGWPDRVFDHIEPDRRTYVVLLSHDARFEVPVLEAVKGKPIKYLGAMGSRRTHAMRAERLASDGWTDAEIAEIHAPIGLDLKGATPAETAIAIAGEIIQTRYGAGSGVSLRGTDVAIHG